MIGLRALLRETVRCTGRIPGTDPILGQPQPQDVLEGPRTRCGVCHVVLAGQGSGGKLMMSGRESARLFVGTCDGASEI